MVNLSYGIALAHADQDTRSACRFSRTTGDAEPCREVDLRMCLVAITILSSEARANMKEMHLSCGCIYMIYEGAYMVKF